MRTKQVRRVVAQGGSLQPAVRTSCCWNASDQSRLSRVRTAQMTRNMARQARFPSSLLQCTYGFSPWQIILQLSLYCIAILLALPPWLKQKHQNGPIWGLLCLWPHGLMGPSGALMGPPFWVLCSSGGNLLCGRCWRNMAANQRSRRSSVAHPQAMARLALLS